MNDAGLRTRYGGVLISGLLMLSLVSCAGSRREPAAVDERGAMPVTGSAAADSASGAPAESTANDLEPSLSALEDRIRLAIDRVRRGADLAPLTILARLTRLARGHSADMAERSFLDHTSPDGRTPADNVKDWGFPAGLVGENIARVPRGEDPVRFVIDAWMQSPPHRANIVNDDFTHTGVGVFQGAQGEYRGEFFVTQVFFAYATGPRVFD